MLLNRTGRLFERAMGKGKKRDRAGVVKKVER
jgi:hypothetical protein